MAKGITGVPPKEYDPLGSLPGKGGRLHRLLEKGVMHSFDTAFADNNCHTIEVDGQLVITNELGAPHRAEAEE